MRSVLALSLCLLVIAGLMRWVGLGSTSSAERAGPDGGLTIIAAGRGSMLPPARLPGGDEILDDAILIGDLILKPKRSADGLRVAVLSPGLVFDAYHSFDLAASAEDAARFLALSGLQPTGALLVLASFGTVAPEPDSETFGALAERLTELGAETKPFAPARASWAMITVRRPQGWVKLAEAHGEVNGVALTFTVSSDLSIYDGYRGETTLFRMLGNAPIRLEDELSSAEVTVRTRRVKARVGGEVRSAIESPPVFVRGAEDLPSSVLWRDVPLGRRAQFRCGIGLKDGSWEVSDGAVFSLRIDGEEVHAERLVPEPEPPTAWRDWVVDLRRFAGRMVDLELVVDPGRNAFSDRALWGAPRLIRTR